LTLSLTFIAKIEGSRPTVGILTGLFRSLLNKPIIRLIISDYVWIMCSSRRASCENVGNR